MVQPFSKSLQSHLPRYLVAGGLTAIALWWGVSFLSPKSASHVADNAAAVDQGSLSGDSQALGQEEFGVTQSEDAQKQAASSALRLSPEADGIPQSSANQMPNTVGIGSSPTPVMLSDGSRLEDQLQAQRSAELHDRYPVEGTPSGVATKPPAVPGAVNPHQ